MAEKLYLKTENENIPIPQDQIEKHHLQAGMVSPFTRYTIVDKNNSAKAHTKKEVDPSEIDLANAPRTRVFTTSESIDISQGVDSDTAYDKKN